MNPKSLTRLFKWVCHIVKALLSNLFPFILTFSGKEFAHINHKYLGKKEPYLGKYQRDYGECLWLMGDHDHDLMILYR